MSVEHRGPAGGIPRGGRGWVMGNRGGKKATLLVLGSPTGLSRWRRSPVRHKATLDSKLPSPGSSLWGIGGAVMGNLANDVLTSK